MVGEPAGRLVVPGQIGGLALLEEAARGQVARGPDLEVGVAQRLDVLPGNLELVALQVHVHIAAPAGAKAALHAPKVPGPQVGRLEVVAEGGVARVSLAVLLGDANVRQNCVYYLHLGLTMSGGPEAPGGSGSLYGLGHLEQSSL